MSVDTSITSLQSVVTNAVTRVTQYANRASAVELDKYSYQVVPAVAGSVVDITLPAMPTVYDVDPNSLASVVASALDEAAGVGVPVIASPSLTVAKLLAATSPFSRAADVADALAVTASVRREFKSAVAAVKAAPSSWGSRGFRSSQPRMGGDSFDIGASAFEATHAGLSNIYERRVAALTRVLWLLSDTITDEYKRAVERATLGMSRVTVGEDVRNTVRQLLQTNQRQALANAKAVMAASNAVEDVKLDVTKTNLRHKETLDVLKTRYEEAGVDVIINGALAKATAMGSVGSAARSAQNVIIGVIAGATE